MAYQVKDYKVDFSLLTDRDQLGNALLWSLEQFREIAGRNTARYNTDTSTEKESVYQQVLQAFVAEANELYAAVTDLGKRRTVAYADGVWLEGIGRIVGQPKETVPNAVPDGFFYWDDDGTRETWYYNPPPSGQLSGKTNTGDPHYLDTFNNWVSFAGDEAVTSGAPDDGAYRQQIIRRIYQNANRNSSYAEIRSVAMDLLGLSDLWISYTDGSAATPLAIRTIKFWVPDNTPTWKKDFLVGKSYGIIDGKPWNKWYLPLPSCVQVDSTVGLMSAW
jgi:hypothetical protein